MTLLLLLLCVPVYIFISGGFSVITVLGAISWILVSLGYLAYKGGSKKAGSIIVMVGVLTAIGMSFLQ